MSSMNLGSILIFASCVVGTCNKYTMWVGVFTEWEGSCFCVFFFIFDMQCLICFVFLRYNGWCWCLLCVGGEF